MKFTHALQGALTLVALSGLFGCSPVIQAAAGAGFAGLDIAETLQKPAMCRTPASCGDTLLTDSLDLLRNTHYSWRPAISTGVTFKWFPAKIDPLGVGIGGHIAFVPETSGGRTNPFPVVAVSVGNRDRTELMFGLILSPTDDVAFPNGKQTYRVAIPKKVGQSLPDFSLPNTRKSRNLFIAVKVFGVGQDEQTAAGTASEPPTRIELSVTTPMSVNQVQLLRVEAYDKNGIRVFPAGGYTFESDAPDVIEIISGGRAIAHKAGTAHIKARSGNVSDTKEVVVNSQ